MSCEEEEVTWLSSFGSAEVQKVGTVSKPASSIGLPLPPMQAIPVTLTMRSPRTRKGFKKCGELPVPSPFSNSFSKTGQCSLRRKLGFPKA